MVARRPKNLLIFLAACFIIFEKQLESVRRKDRKEFRFQKSRQSYSFQIYEKISRVKFFDPRIRTVLKIFQLILSNRIPKYGYEPFMKILHVPSLNSTKHSHFVHCNQLYLKL